MPGLRSRLRAAEITASSPRGAVTLSGSGTGAFTVSAPRGALRGASDTALGNEITGLVQAAMQAVRRTYVEARRSASAHDSPGHAPPVPQDPASAGDQSAEDDNGRSAPARAAAFRDALDVPLTGASHGGYVTVTRAADHTIATDVRPGTVRQLDETALADEIQSALAETLRAYEEAYASAYRAAFGNGPGGGQP